ncbi:MAG: ATP-binding protein [Clostridiaceae bacterium]|nr:ATP-binding protein [Clostridiaceae bacterium]
MVMHVDISHDTKIYSKDIATDAYLVCNEVRSILDMLQLRFLLDSEKCFDIKVILCELLQNSIKHGNVCDESKKIRLEIWYKSDNNVLGITVKDQGSGIKPIKIKHLTLDDVMDCDPANMNESGRGLFIVNELCDRMEFNSTGNAITVMKRI